MVVTLYLFAEIFALYCLTNYSCRLLMLFLGFSQSFNDFFDLVTINDNRIKPKSSEFLSVDVVLVSFHCLSRFSEAISIDHKSQVTEFIISSERSSLPNRSLCAFPISNNAICPVLYFIKIFAGISDSYCHGETLP